MVPQRTSGQGARRLVRGIARILPTLT